MNKLTIVIPVFNEEKTIITVLNRLKALSLGVVRKEILIVDDGSDDNTADLVKAFIRDQPDFSYFRLAKNKGKGEALRFGFRKATGDYLIIQDADLEYNPEDIPRLIQPIKEKKTRVVFGTRLRRYPNFRRDERTLLFFIHYVGNKGLSLLTSLLYGQYLTDIETGYKIIPKEFYQKKSLKAHGFEIEPEITVQLLKAGYSIHEIPITTTPRGYTDGKKLQTIPDGLKALVMLLKLRI